MNKEDLQYFIENQQEGMTQLDWVEPEFFCSVCGTLRYWRNDCVFVGFVCPGCGDLDGTCQ